MPEPILSDPQRWTADLLPGSARWQQSAAAPPLPEALLNWLVDLRLLRQVPFDYLVPQPSWLPQESIRFFYVDPTFTDRLADGAWAAGQVGTSDQALSVHTMQAVRAQVDEALAARAGLPAGSWRDVTVTGMLVRATAVRRWPTMEVRAFAAAQGSARVPTLRHDRLADGLSITLFAGVPGRVELQEPNEGTHFGVAPDPSTPGAYILQPRNDQDQALPPMPVPLRGVPERRLIDLEALGPPLSQALGGQVVESSRLALSLQRTPFVQVLRGASVRDDQYLDQLSAALAAAVKGQPT